MDMYEKNMLAARKNIIKAIKHMAEAVSVADDIDWDNV